MTCLSKIAVKRLLPQPERIGHLNSEHEYEAGACCEMSRRDGAIVAWHEVPGTAPPPQECRPVGYGLIRAGVRTDSMIMPYPTGRFFRGTFSQALRARLRSVLSLWDTQTFRNRI